MTLETIAETAPIIERLDNLRKLMPGRQEHFYRFYEEFAKLMCERKRLVPSGFCSLAEKVLYDFDIKNIEDPFSRLKIGMELVETIPYVAKATCPKDFAEGVEEIYNTS